MSTLTPTNDKPMPLTYKLIVKKPIQLMEAMLQAFVENGRLSLEGDLKQLNVQRFQHISQEPDEVLQRNTGYPKQDFVIIPLDPATIDYLIKSVLPMVGIRWRVEHVQIEQNGHIVFGAYDYFHPEMVGVDIKISEELLRNLKENGILRSYECVNLND